MAEANLVERIKELLKSAAPGRVAQIDQMFARLSPVFVPDKDEQGMLFKAFSDSNIILIGVEATRRLEAHALATAIVATGFSNQSNTTRQEREELFAAADSFLNWAVSHDLQQWLMDRDGLVRPVASIMAGAAEEVSSEQLAGLDEAQLRYGRGLFLIAVSFILLHELGHLHFGHEGCSGFWSLQQEKDADRFAADWLLEPSLAAGRTEPMRRINTLFGISIALLWLTVYSCFLGHHSGATHPQSYDRLYQVLNQFIDPGDSEEFLMVWDLVSCLLHLHMDTAGFTVDWERMQGDPRDQVNYLIDLLSRN